MNLTGATRPMRDRFLEAWTRTWAGDERPRCQPVGPRSRQQSLGPGNLRTHNPPLALRTWQQRLNGRFDSEAGSSVANVTLTKSLRSVRHNLVI